MEHKIEEQIAKISTKTNGWSLELNKVSWNGNPAKLDIRNWNEDHSKCSKGITLTEEEAGSIHKAFTELLEK